MVNSTHEMGRKSFRYEDMVKCVFGLNSLDFEIYDTLLLHGTLTAEGLREIVNRDKNTAHYSLEKLIACGIVYRRKRSIASGGYYYEYIPVESAKVRQVLKKDIGDWYYCMSKLIEKKESVDN